MRVVKIPEFITKWSAAQAAERANKDLFLTELCDVLEVPRPNPSTGDREKDTYVFERDALLPHEGGAVTVGRIDLYRAGCFILEAKQGSDTGAAKKGTAKRDTPAWNIAMRDAYGQALGYARSFEKPVPFLVTCDIGYCFDLYAAFDGSWDYRPFPTPQQSRIFLADVEKHKDTLRAIFTEPFALDPSKKAAKVTRIVAEHLAELAKTLEKAGHPPDAIATFLMRCLFTMFAEDVGLLPEGVFTKAIEQFWIPNPPSFPGGVEDLWRTMNDGGQMFMVGKILRFNGGLFASPVALPLDKKGLSQLLEAAKCDWSGVEPAIFGTLLERALDSRERHRLGAHYTPRAYVERLVKPTIEEPLRAEWQIVQAQVRQLVADAEAAKSDKASKGKMKEAVEAVKTFQKRLSTIRVLDPACGSGNFLYVTLDLFKRLEAEVLSLLGDLGEKQELLGLEGIRVTPAQFLGIEVKRWAKEIAELVLWIGYLQWHFRTYGRNLPVPEPVLRDYKNIECRDAVLAYDREELVRDEKGKPITRWDGVTFKKSPVTGEDVPDEQARVPTYTYVNPRKAEWPQADFIVGNPPFVANRNMRSLFGDGYTEALRIAYPEIREPVDFVMFFWLRGSDAVLAGAHRSGLITTSRIRLMQNQGVVRRCLDAGTRMVFAIPDHPWPDGSKDAEVRIAMTVLAGQPCGQARIVHTPTHDKIARGRFKTSEVIESDLRHTLVGSITPDLSAGIDVSQLADLQATRGLLHAGMKPYGTAFIVSEELATKLLPEASIKSQHAPPYRNGHDIGQRPRDVRVLDFYGLTEDQLRQRHPEAYQYLFDTARVERSQERNERLRREWWLFEASRPELRQALSGLSRFIVTVEASPVRAFVFLKGGTLPDQKLRVTASSDAFLLGVLSSRAHEVFAHRVGGRQGVRNTPVYNSRCFTRFPFPDCSQIQAARVRDLGEQLDVHRWRQLQAHPSLTLTGMYNVVEKLRLGEPLTDRDRRIHEEGLVSVLKKHHDDIDDAVFDAYGWPRGLSDEEILERLVSLNAKRKEEERQGTVRWLRPELQNPGGAPATQVTMSVTEADPQEAEPSEPSSAASWPKKLPDQVATLRDLVVQGDSPWTAARAASSFKGAKPKDVEPVLDSLAALGLLIAYDTASGRRWRAPSSPA